MPASRPIEELRKRAAELIIMHAKKLSFAIAAKELKVSRQALYAIERGDFCPSLALIQRACETWNIEFQFRGLNVGKDTIRQKTKAEIRPTQLDLLKALKSQQFQIARVKLDGRSLELTLRLKVPA